MSQEDSTRSPPTSRPLPAFAAVVALVCLAILPLAASASSDPGEPALLVRVVRTGSAEASVLGVAVTPSDVVELLVDGSVRGTTTPAWNLDYWFLHVPVTDRSVVRTRIGSLESPIARVPSYALQPTGPPGFVYAQGTQFLIDGLPVRFFGVNEPTAFPYALIASGLYGWTDPERYWGENRLFPSGPDARIANVSSPDSLWRAYFRYFLHYRESASEPSHPAANLLRIWIVDENFGLEKAYAAWKADPATFWGIFDDLVHWAGRAGVYLVPVLGHMDVDRDNRMYDSSSPLYARHLELVRAIVARYDDDARIAMWDLWNEADVNNDAYWAGVGGIAGYRAWAARYLADVKPYAANHLLTLGTGGWTRFPGVPDFGWRYHFFFNEIPGLEVSSHHGYATSEDAYLVDWQTGWHEALGIPHYEGEYGYNEFPGTSGIGVGYWPWYTETTRAAGWPAISPMVFLDNGRGAYADYPYDGSLPEYPPSDPRPVDVPPVAAFTASPSRPVAGSPVLFDASISSDDVGIVRYEWRFGDGRIASGAVVTHMFRSPGDYPVTLTVTDTAGFRDAWTFVVSVAPVPFPPPPVIYPCGPPRVPFAALLGAAVSGWCPGALARGPCPGGARSPPKPS